MGCIASIESIFSAKLDSLQACTPHGRLGMNLRPLLYLANKKKGHVTVSLSTRLKYFTTQDGNIFRIYMMYKQQCKYNIFDVHEMMCLKHSCYCERQSRRVCADVDEFHL